MDVNLRPYSAGEAGVGIGELIVMALEKAGVPHAEAMRHCYFMDSKGLVCKSRLEVGMRNRLS